MKPRLPIVALAACVAMISFGAAQAQKKGGDVIIAMQAAPPSLDPHVTSAQVARNVNLHVFETLYARDENARPVRTASSEQVSKPIYREGVDHWRNFDPWLGPLKDALGPVLDLYPAVPEFVAGERVTD